MSREEFLCCDNPSCDMASKAEDADLRSWVDVRITVVIDDQGHVDHLEGHACSGACVGPVAVALHEERTS